MERLFDRKVQARSFQIGNQVLALLPFSGHSRPFQAKFTGPYMIAKCYPNNYYLLNTSDHRKKVQVCHVNLLKPYMTPVSSLPLNVVTTDIIDSGVSETSVGMADVLEEKNSPSRSIVEGSLKNSEVLSNLAYHLSHLCEPEKNYIIQLYIYIYSQTQPVKHHPYRVYPIKRKLLQKEVDYLLAYNWAEPSFSSWSPPSILVSKSDNSYRFCTDYRKLNSLTKPDCFLLPRIDDCGDHVGFARFVSKFDLLKGYWQVPLTSHAKELSVFITPDIFLQYTVMPFGVQNAPATFQRLVNRVLSGLIRWEAYLDDIVLYSSSWNEHLAQIK